MMMASDTAQPGKPTVVYSPLRLNWKNVVAGTVIALLMVAIGVFSFTYYNPDATPVPPVVIKSGTQSAKTSKATPSAKNKETAGWKTYESKIHYYSINYPSSWTFSKLSKELGPNYFAEEVYLNVNSQKPTDQPNVKIMGNYQYPQGGWCKENTNPNCLEEQVELGGIDATKWTGTGEEDEIYYVKPTSNYFVVIFVNYGGNKKLTDQVLSTLRFD